MRSWHDARGGSSQRASGCRGYGYFLPLYVVGSGALWWTAPQDSRLFGRCSFSAIGLIGMEFATILPTLTCRNCTPTPANGRAAVGVGLAFGYARCSGADRDDSALFSGRQHGPHGWAGQTAVRLDPATKADTRHCRPLTAILGTPFS